MVAGTKQHKWCRPSVLLIAVYIDLLGRERQATSFHKGTQVLLTMPSACEPRAMSWLYLHLM